MMPLPGRLYRSIRSSCQFVGTNLEYEHDPTGYPVLTIVTIGTSDIVILTSAEMRVHMILVEFFHPIHGVCSNGYSDMDSFRGDFFEVI